MLRYLQASLCEDQTENEIYRGVWFLGTFNSFKKQQFGKKNVIQHIRD